MAADIASSSPLSLAGNKRILRVLRAEAAALPPDVEQELMELRESCFRSEDFAEGVGLRREARAEVAGALARGRIRPAPA